MSSRHRSTQPPTGPDRHTLVTRLWTAGCVFAEEEVDLLLGAASGPELAELLERRVAGEPLEHLLGRVDFCGLRLAVAAGVFVPRQRTAHLARLAADLAPHVAVDLCCGVGAVAAVVAARRPDSRVVAADMDPAAVACAERNLPGAEVCCGDLFDPLPADLRGRVDVLAVNAPYVPTGELATMPPEARDHEPWLALDGGPDGLDVHRRVAAEAPSWLRSGGHLLAEVGEPQVEAALALLTSVGLVPRVDHDEELGATVVLARRT
ncbi:putative protein N(5)-glutamine methyltransferase [Nocardioides mangrovicus]|uniref:peptide chain release factor N(5)-glutamine methyltransferase n=1 Tax=Nocardioides mangrovicus TaxID=2478913 RepID=A0A3L8P0Y0_9ACTN|nr:putative protein N(5)-glutamine methyltransferase [Nocardioides mangrovicus]RLV48681.1 putative protein N(5)-glutamine methyltransferase [Nocardioides mangrovicus]